MRKINMTIITLTVLAICIEIARGNYPWELNEGVVFFKNSDTYKPAPIQTTYNICPGSLIPNNHKN